MGVNLIRIAYGLTVGNAVVKDVLVALADSGCDNCGLAWPGVSYLERKTELGATSIRSALSALTKQGLIEVRAYAKGGHGRATEYLVLSHLAKLSTSPCEKCQSNLLNPSRGGGYDKDVTKQPTARRWVKKQPTAKQGTYPSRGGDQPSVEPYPPHGTAVENSPSARPPTLSEPDPTPWAENAAQARSLADLLGPTPTPDRPATVNGDVPTAETEGRQGEAQD